jgi:hypothetical protein
MPRRLPYSGLGGLSGNASQYSDYVTFDPIISTPARAKQSQAAATEPPPADDDSDWLVDVTAEREGCGVQIIGGVPAPEGDDGERVMLARRRRPTSLHSRRNTH